MKLKHTGTDGMTGKATGVVWIKDLGERSSRTNPSRIMPNNNYGSKDPNLLATLVNPPLQTYKIGADGFIRLEVTADSALVDYYRVTVMDIKNGYSYEELPKTGVDAKTGDTVSLYRTNHAGQNRYIRPNEVVEFIESGEFLASASKGAVKQFIDRGILQVVA